MMSGSRSRFLMLMISRSRVLMRVLSVPAVRFCARRMASLYCFSLSRSRASARLFPAGVMVMNSAMLRTGRDDDGDVLIRLDGHVGQRAVDELDRVGDGQVARGDIELGTPIHFDVCDNARGVAVGAVTVAGDFQHRDRAGALKVGRSGSLERGDGTAASGLERAAVLLDGRGRALEFTVAV